MRGFGRLCYPFTPQACGGTVVLREPLQGLQRIYVDSPLRLADCEPVGNISGAAAAKTNDTREGSERRSVCVIVTD